MRTFKDLLSGSNRQWLMGFAMLWVIAFHFGMYGNLLHLSSINFFAGKGYLGVDVFIFLSCYGLCHSYNNRSLKDFYLQRFRRLFPMYLVFLIALLLLFPIEKPWITAMLMISGLSNFFQIEHEWYVPALIVIYLLFPLIYHSVKWLYSKGLLWVNSVILLLVICEPFLAKGIFYLFVIRFPLIVIAISAFFAVNDDSKNKLMGVLVFAALIGFGVTGKEMLNGSQTGMLTLPLILYGLSMLRIKFPYNRILCFLGRHTLEIYLAQNLALNQFYANYDINFTLKTFIALGIIVLGSFILWAIQEVWVRSTRLL